MCEIPTFCLNTLQNLYSSQKPTDTAISDDFIAKKCSTRRFHALYDKVYRKDVLIEAWKRAKENHGSSGVDGIRIEDIEAIGLVKYLGEIQKELVDGRYDPSPVKRIMIPKPGNFSW